MKSILLLCSAAIFVGSPLNGLSPAFTTVASDMGFNSLSRDLYFAPYISLSMMIGQIIGSLLGGYIADIYNRRNFLCLCIAADAIGLFLFGVPQSMTIFLLLRTCMGFFQGLAIPIIFSLIGDLFQTEARVIASAAASACLGGGLLLGQLFCGFILQYWNNWRIPFILLAIFGIALSALLSINLEEPSRDTSSNNSIISNMADKPKQVSGSSYLQLYRHLCSPTIVLMLIQSVPGSVPWGVLSTHLQDLLTADFNVPVPQATFFIGVFGIGGAAGGVASGLIGGILYSRSSMYLPLFMGSTCALSSALLQLLFTTQFDSTHQPNAITALLILAGACAAVSGTNVRTVIINVTVSDFRGSAIGLLNVLGCIGRGIGPSLTGLYMAYTGASRADSIRVSLLLWIFSGAVLCIGGLTISKDEEKVRSGMKKYAPVDTEPDHL